MYNSPKDILDALRASGEVFTALLDGVSQEAARKAVGGDEEWSVVEVLCHLRDAESHALARNRLMRDEDHPKIEGYDQEQLAKDADYASQDLRQALSAFLDYREQNVVLLEGLSPEQWARPGLHSDVGEITIQNHMIHMVAHDAVHAAQIARQLGKA